MLMDVRTTVTLEKDVAAAVERLRRERGLGLSAAVNDLIRIGLAFRQAKPERFVQKTYDMGPELIDVTNVAEALAQAEGEDWRS